MRILVIGYGNPFREDDGVGHHMASRLFEELSSRGIAADLRLEQQLLPEMAEDLGACDVVVFADASMTETENGWLVEELAPSDSASGLNIHSFSPSWLLALAREIGVSTPRAFLLSVTGVSFDFSDVVTSECRERAERALAEFLARLDAERAV